ncbi:hypothetical protein MPSEU_000357400 [Mayamaea pseudoterrestris]|nr:hypothetical protein MPSEU_000357400 [Mayamaea pseudoterrestris]
MIGEKESFHANDGGLSSEHEQQQDLSERRQQAVDENSPQQHQTRSQAPLNHGPDATIRLYGRDTEQARLCDAFRRRCCCQDELAAELVLVTGSSGSGKTALITNTLQKQAQACNGFFLRGKFDSLERMEAYYPFVRAFSDFVQRILEANDENQLQQIQQALRSIAPAQPLLVDMIPALDVLFVDPVISNEGEVKATGAQKRLQFAFGEFLRALCSPSQPLCLFLDDLQWAQPASIDLISFLVTENIPGLLVVGACRGREVSLDHHLSVTLREMEANLVSIQAIVLDSLSTNAIADMVRDISGMVDEPISNALAELVLTKSSDNTLYVVELVRTLAEEGLLASDNDQGELLSKVEERISGSLDLIENKVQSMPKHVQQVLMLASCLGAEFDEYVLRKLISFDIKAALTMALNRGVIWQDRGNCTWRFSHDQIQQATYSLVPEDEKEMAHLSIGRTLLATLEQDQLEYYFFLVVNQLSFGIRLMTDKDERSQFASLLVLAGQKAAQSFTFLTASTYLELGISLLEDRRWRDQYELAMELYHAAAESEYCNGHYRRTDELVKEILDNARSDSEKIGAFTISIYSLGSRNEMAKAVELGLKVLREYAGYNITTNASTFTAMIELVKTKRLLRKFSDDAILNVVPVMSDERELAAMRIMSIIFAYAIHFRPMLGAILALRLVRMSIERGCSGMSSVGFCSLAMIFCNGFGEVKLGIRLARLSIQLLDKFQSREWLPRVYSAVYGLCYSYSEPLRNNLKPLLMAHRVGLVSGDIEFSALAAAMYAGVGSNAGVALSQIVDECSAFLQMMRQHNQSNMAQFITPTLQFAKCLMGVDCREPSLLSGDVMDAPRALHDATLSNNRTIVAFIHWMQMILSGFFGDYESVIQLANKLENSCDCSNFGCYNRANWYLHEVLACFSSKVFTKQRAMKVARRDLKRLQSIASYSEHNFTTHVFLVEAEMAIAKGKFSLGMMKYNHAIVRANDEALWHLAGLSHERAAKALRDHGKATAKANAHLEKAIDAYETWGAMAKVARLRATMGSREQAL